ncbi:transposase [Pendulispora albinea]|uniref:Transposase n=1 Tax=Pendulispora albinea TaxID=2741071 RepID=A0ABZ2MC44_9BACT
MGRSRGGFSTKLHAVVDTKGRPIHIALTPGQRHEMMAADELLQHARGKALIGDTGYDSNRFLQAVHDKGMKPVIHPKPERLVKPRLARKLYRRRYLVEEAQTQTVKSWSASRWSDEFSSWFVDRDIAA